MLKLRIKTTYLTNINSEQLINDKIKLFQLLLNTNIDTI